MSEPRDRGWGRGDGLGTWAPIGGSGGEKEFFRLPEKVEKLAPAASVLIRGRTPEKLRGLYGLAATLLGDYEPGLTFIANMVGAALGERGLARSEYNMALARMLVPNSMPAADLRGDGHGRQSDYTKRSKKERAEEDE
jgi:hypothetical protein